MLARCSCRHPCASGGADSLAFVGTSVAGVATPGQESGSIRRAIPIRAETRYLYFPGCFMMLRSSSTYWRYCLATLFALSWLLAGASGCGRSAIDSTPPVQGVGGSGGGGG